MSSFYGSGGQVSGDVWGGDDPFENYPQHPNKAEVAAQRAGAVGTGNREDRRRQRCDHCLATIPECKARRNRTMTRLTLILALLAAPAFAADYRVIDGDTIEVRGQSYRFADWDAPETWRPECEAERALGHAATAFMRDLMEIGAVYLTGEMCGYGRPCIVGVLPNGQTFGQAMIAAGLAQQDIHVNGKRTGPKPEWCR